MEETWREYNIRI